MDVTDRHAVGGTNAFPFVGPDHGRPVCRESQANDLAEDHQWRGQVEHRDAVESVNRYAHVGLFPSISSICATHATHHHGPPWRPQPPQRASATERSATEKRSPLTSTRRALVVIDVQNEYFDGPLAVQFPPPRRTSLDNIVQALDIAAEQNLPVVVVRHELPDGAPVFGQGSIGAQLHPRIADRVSPRGRSPQSRLPALFPTSASWNGCASETSTRSLLSVT